MTEHYSYAGWHVDAEGWLRSASGCKLARITPAGLWVWDKRAECEVCLSLAELARLIGEAAHKAA